MADEGDDEGGIAVLVGWLGLDQRFLRGLLDHREGPKDGPCFIQGELVGSTRRSKSVRAMHVLGVDLDTGQTALEIDAAIRARGLAAVRYSTHSHGKATTAVNRDAYHAKGDGTEPVAGEAPSEPPTEAAPPASAEQIERDIRAARISQEIEQLRPDDLQGVELAVKAIARLDLPHARADALLGQLSKRTNTNKSALRLDHRHLAKEYRKRERQKPVAAEQKKPTDGIEIYLDETDYKDQIQRSWQGSSGATRHRRGCSISAAVARGSSAAPPASRCPSR